MRVIQSLILSRLLPLKNPCLHTVRTLIYTYKTEWGGLEADQTPWPVSTGFLSLQKSQVHGSRHHLGQLKTCRSPIFKILKILKYPLDIAIFQCDLVSAEKKSFSKMCIFYDFRAIFQFFNFLYQFLNLTSHNIWHGN